MLRPTHVSAAEAPEDLWRCHECGWTYPNHHPSAKHRRNHKKQCGKLPGFPISGSVTPGDSPSGYPALSPSYYASSDEENLRSPPYAGADDKNEHSLDLSPTSSPVPGLELASGSGDQVSASLDVGQLSAGNSPAASSFDNTRSFDISKTDAESNFGLPDESSPEMPGTRNFRSARAEGSRWICRHCGWTYPKAHPSAKHRRNHKKKCGAAGYAGTAGSSDEASSDEDRNHLKGKIPLGSESPASQLGSELQASFSPNVSSTTIPAAAKDITSLKDTSDESFEDETRPAKTERNLKSEDKAIVDPVSEQSQTTIAPDAEESRPLVARGSNGLEQGSGAFEEVRDPAPERRTDDEGTQVDNDDKLGSKHVEDSSELKESDLQAAGHAGTVAEGTGEQGALNEREFHNDDVRRAGGIFEVAEGQELQTKFSTSEFHGVSPHEAPSPKPEVSSRESIGIPESGDSISETPQPVGFDAAESPRESLNFDAEQKSRALELSGAGEDPVADLNVVDETESIQEPTVMSSGDSNHIVAKDERADEDQAEKVPDSSHKSESPLPSGTEMIDSSAEPLGVADLDDGNSSDHFEGQTLPPSSKGRPESEKTLSNGTIEESEKGLGIDSSDQRVVGGLNDESSPPSDGELKSPSALGIDSHELPAAGAETGEEKLPEHSEEPAPSPSASRVPDGMTHEKESSGAESSALELTVADHHGLAEQQEESGESSKFIEDGDIDAGGGTKVKLDKKFEGSQVPVSGSASSPGDRIDKPAAAGSKLQTAEPGGRRAEVQQEALQQSSESGKVADSSSPEGLVRARVQAFEKLAGAGVDYQQRRKSFSPSKFPSPGTAMTPGAGGFQHFVQNNNSGGRQAETATTVNSNKNVDESPTDLQEAISHLRHGYASESPNSNSNGNAASAERDSVAPSEAFQVKSHLRHSGKIF